MQRSFRSAERLSYLIGSEGEALVVDPALAPELYRKQARQRNWTITDVLDTHVHADHLSRAHRLADLTEASLYLPEQAQVSYPYTPLRDHESISIGAVTVTALHTPAPPPKARPPGWTTEPSSRVTRSSCKGSVGPTWTLIPRKDGARPATVPVGPASHAPL